LENVKVDLKQKEQELLFAEEKAEKLTVENKTLKAQLEKLLKVRLCSCVSNHSLHRNRTALAED
jgi:hypothetical protein